MTGISPTQSNVQRALREFLLAVLPTTGGDGEPVEVISAVQNRVPEPKGTDFVVMSVTRFARLRTNVDGDEDVRFTGSIAGLAMTVTDVSFGTIRVGATVFGVGVTPGTRVTALGTGTGGVGTYATSPSQTVASGVLSTGEKTAEQGAEVTVQLDFHSRGLEAADMAQVASTLLRDAYGVDFFAALAPPLNGVVPLYADDPRQAPFTNEAQQVEWRWVLEAKLQVDQVVLVPQQYADAVSVVARSVEAEFPP